jgi:glycosyltransferase involved in cell wall biosynthesis
MQNRSLDVVSLESYRSPSAPSIAVIIPCYNEGAAIEETVHGFRRALPQSVVYVFDNNSTDNTIACAQRAGAVVRSEPRQGKGNVVRRMFADVEADLYVLVDGDMTYDPAAAPIMIHQLIGNSLDMKRGPDEFPGLDVWPRLLRHLVRLPGVFQAVRQNLPFAIKRL